MRRLGRLLLLELLLRRLAPGTHTLHPYPPATHAAPVPLTLAPPLLTLLYYDVSHQVPRGVIVFTQVARYVASFTWALCV